MELNWGKLGGERGGGGGGGMRESLREERIWQRCPDVQGTRTTTDDSTAYGRTLTPVALRSH